ncbi:Beta-mannosidase [Orchesella cincta]|uniref:Beta-mannosidase n=1 Tax=Orchesella cincta TaxID=48709 RepID=A0A1D2M356_ORCCI|nr:Beta-mannosidase [Orchesella cincta]
MFSNPTEINGRWKLLMYYSIKFFAPVLASPYLNRNGDLVVELISDSGRNFSGNLTVQIFGLKSLTPLFEQNVKVKAQFLTSKEVFRVNKTALQELNCGTTAKAGSLNPCVVYLTLPGTPDNFLFLQYPTNKLALRNPNLQITLVEAVNTKTVNFTVTTDAIAPFVFFTVRGDHRGYFSDNGFVLVTQERKMNYYSESGITPQQFMDRLQVMSLYDVTKVAGSQVGVNSNMQLHRARSLQHYYRSSDENSVHLSHWLRDEY